MERVVLRVAALSAALLLVGTVWPARAQQRRDTVVVLLGQEPAELFDGFIGNQSVELDVTSTIYCELVGRNDRWELYTELAEKVPSLKDGDWQLLPGGKMKVTYRLKRGFKWHDGKPVTTADFVWTLRMRKNPLTPVISRFVDDKIDNIVATDPYTMTFQWKELYPYANIGYDVLPAHVLAKDFNRDPAQLDRSPFARAPVHCGPYRLKQWVAGSFIEVEAAADTYGGEKPKIPAIVFRFILDSTVLTATLIAGQGDATGINQLSLEQLDEIGRRAPQMQTHAVEGTNYEHIDFNLDHEWFRDKRVRHAIAHAIDREGIVRSLFGGRIPVAHAFASPKHQAYNKDVRRYPYDPARARQLLAEAGFTTGPDGVLRDRTGKRFEVSIMTTSGNAVREQIQQIIKEQLRQVGIELTIDNRPASVLFGQVTRERTFPHLVMFAWTVPVTSHSYTVWHSSQIPTAANNFVGQNVTGNKNPEVDRLLEASEKELDAEKRAGLLRQVQALLVEDLPSIPLYYRPEFQVSRKALKNYKVRGLGQPTWNAAEWSW